MNPLNIVFRDDREKFEFFFLGGLLGIVFFNFFVLMNPADPGEPKPDFKLFILAWSACPALGIFSTRVLHALKTRFFPGEPGFYPALIFSNLLVILVYLQPNWGVHFFRGNGWAFLGVFTLLQVVGVGLSAFLGKSKKNPDIREDDPHHLYRWALLAFVGWIFSNHSLDRLLRGWGFLNYLFLLGTLGLFYFLMPFRGGEKPASGSGWSLGPVKIPKSLPLYGVVFLLIAWLVIDPYFPYQRYHGGYYLGPLSDLIGGKSLLFNINAQYGVLVFYFLKLFFVFLPLGYTSFSWVLTLLIVAQYCVFYFIARRLFRSGLYSFLVLVSLLLLNHFAQTPRPSIVPSVGPLRFGFIYVLLALVLLRNRYPAWKNPVLWLEALVMGTAFFWSYEVCFYTLPPYLAFVFFESGVSGKGMGLDWGGLLKRFLKLGTCVALVAAFLYLDVHARSGEWPHWSYYLDYIFLYKNGFGSMPRPEMNVWCLLAGTLYFSFFAILAIALHRKEGKAPLENFNAIALVTFYGIFQYLYFIYRSHPNNLYHVSMPSLLLFAYWLEALRSQDPAFLPRESKKILFAAGVVFIGIYLQTLLPEAAAKIKDQYVPPSDWWRKVIDGARDIPRDDRFAREADELFQKYSGDRKQIPYFFGENGLRNEGYVDYGLDVSIYTGRVKPYPYNDLSQANICPPALARIRDFDPRLQKGDYLYYRPSPPASPVEEEDLLPENIDFEKNLVDHLFIRYDLRLVEEKDGIDVYRVRGAR